MCSMCVLCTEERDEEMVPVHMIRVVMKWAWRGGFFVLLDLTPAATTVLLHAPHIVIIAASILRRIHLICDIPNQHSQIRANPKLVMTYIHDLMIINGF